jgi:hypothetical protein
MRELGVEQLREGRCMTLVDGKDDGFTDQGLTLYPLGIDVAVI